MKKIKEWIKRFINKYIVSEDPCSDEEKIFIEKIKQFEEWQKPVEPSKPVKKKRGRPKKKK